MRSELAVLGGTFDRLHAGHRALLAAAFARARHVAIGVTTERYLRAHPKPLGSHIASYASRRRALVRFLSAHYPASRWRVVPLEDGWGRSVEPGPDLLVASAETRSGALAVNRERRRRGLPPLHVFLVPIRNGADGLPVSSRRIRAGAIDRDGSRTAPIAVALRGEVGTTRAIRSILQHRSARLPIRLARPGPGAEWSIVARRTPRGTTIILSRPPQPDRSVFVGPRASPTALARAVDRLIR